MGEESPKICQRWYPCDIPEPVRHEVMMCKHCPTSANPTNLSHGQDEDSFNYIQHCGQRCPFSQKHHYLGFNTNKRFCVSTRMSAIGNTIYRVMQYMSTRIKGESYNLKYKY